jgi:hypothetical protein
VTIQETLPAPVEIPTVEGEVVDPQEELRKHENNIRKNFRKMETVVGSVARSLNVIYYNDLWKMHKTADGKRRYTNFNDYLEMEFGWDKTGARARQIMKADLPLAIEAGEVPAEVGDKRRERAAPEVTAVRAAKVTLKQLQTVADAWDTRMNNVEVGTGFDALEAIRAEFAEGIAQTIDDLEQFIADAEAEQEVAQAETVE